MSDAISQSRTIAPRHSFLALSAPFPFACFVGALISDVVYWRSTNFIWADGSAWLLALGLIVSVFVVIAALVAFATDRRIRTLWSTWIFGIGNAIALALAILDSFVHARDAYTSVVPTGLILSAAVVLILLITNWVGRALRYGRELDAYTEYDR